MTTFSPEEARRIAALARLGLAEGEAERLAGEMGAIAASFSDLAAYADALPDAEPPAAGALRADEVAPAAPAVVEGILAAVPRLDEATRTVRVPRGRGD